MKPSTGTLLTATVLLGASVLMVAPAAGAKEAAPDRAADAPVAPGGYQDGIVLHRDAAKADPFVAWVGPKPETRSADAGSGFEWGDAAIGAAVGACGSLALLAVAAGIRRRRVHMTVRPVGASSPE
jgi:hypothetical protein